MNVTIAFMAVIALASLAGCGTVRHEQDGDVHILSYEYGAVPVVEVIASKANETCPDGFEVLKEAKLNDPPTWRWHIRCIDE